MPVLMFCEFGLKMPIHAPFWVVFGGFDPLDETISTNLTKVSSTDHSGSSGILLMLVSIVVPEKLPEQKNVTKKRKKKNMNFWAFLTSFYSNPGMTICNFFDVYVFILWRTAH